MWELNTITKKIKGNVICIENGVRREFTSREDVLKSYGKFYDVVGILAENDTVILEIEDQELRIEKQKEEFVKENIRMYGCEPNIFGGASY